MSFPRVLIVGLGSIGRRHLRNLRALGVTDIFAYRARGLDTRPFEESEQLPTLVPTLPAGLAERPDIVFVTNPTALHLETARLAIRAGAHVFVEKPLSHSVEGVAEFLGEARALGRQVFVGCQFRFHPTLRLAREKLRSGEIGRPLSAQFSMGEYLPGYHPWEDYRQGYSARADLGGGVLLTQIHDIDLLVWFFGRPRRIEASVGTLGDLQIDVEDVAALVCEYPDRLIAEVHLDYLRRPARRWLQIVGTAGTLEWSGEDGLLRLYRPDAAAPEIFSPPTGFQRNDLFQAEISNMLEALNGRSQPATSGEDALDALWIVDEAKRAARHTSASSPSNIFSLQGKVVLLTGAVGLIGREYAEELAAAGATVVLTDRDQTACDRLAAATAQKTGGTLVGLAADLTKPPEIDRLVAEVERRFGRIDVLINNAAMNPSPGDPRAARQFAPFEDYPRELWDEEIAVNLTAVFLLCQRVGAAMARRRSGSIINISSTYGNVAPDHRIYPPGQYKSVGYAATKGAILNLTRYLAGYFGPQGVRVNTLTPGGVEAGQAADFVGRYADRTMLGRMAQRNEYRGAILFLASDASSYMTGANLVVDGGWTAW